MYLYWRQYCV